MIDWPRKKVADLIDGLTAGVSVRSTDGRGYGPAVLKTSAVDQGRFVPDEVKTILPADRQRARCNPMAGSLIISRMNTPAMVGDVGYVRNDYPNLFLPDRLWLARSKRGSRTDMRWLTYLFASEPGAALLHGLASGTSMSMQSIPKDRVLELEIHTPPPVEQHAIGDALESTDDLIATLERLIAKKQAIKQGMMQQLLTGRTRLPGFTGPWREASMSEVANVDPEALTASTDPRALVEYISLEDVERGEILGHTRVRFGSAPSRARRVIKDGDVLFGTVRPNLQSHAIYRGGLKRPIASTGFAVVRAATECSDAQFLFYLLMSHLTTVQVDRIIAGSNYPAVSSGDVRRLMFTFPPLAEQRAIGSVLADCDGEVLILKHRLAKTLDVKQGMMQQLLTGRTRLPVEAVV